MLNKDKGPGSRFTTLTKSGHGYVVPVLDRCSCSGHGGCWPLRPATLPGRDDAEAAAVCGNLARQVAQQLLHHLQVPDASPVIVEACSLVYRHVDVSLQMLSPWSECCMLHALALHDIKMLTRVLAKGMMQEKQIRCRRNKLSGKVLVPPGGSLIIASIYALQVVDQMHKQPSALQACPNFRFVQPSSQLCAACCCYMTAMHVVRPTDQADGDWTRLA